MQEIVLGAGARSPSKVMQMRRSVRNGGKLPAVRVALIDDTLRKKLSRRGIVGGNYFMLEGHHRYEAMKREKKKTINAKVVRKLY